VCFCKADLRNSSWNRRQTAGIDNSSALPHNTTHQTTATTMQENRENKPWEGQLYLCHTSEIVCKLLYKKFFRKQDTTVIYGHWKQVLLQQQRAYDIISSSASRDTLQDDVSVCGDSESEISQYVDDVYFYYYYFLLLLFFCVFLVFML
jgi:hypothetical protein